MGTPVRSTDPADHVVAHRVPVRGQVLRWAPVINTDSWSGGRTSRKVRRPRDHVLFVWFVRHRVCRTPTPLAQLAAGAGATNRKVCVDTVRVGVNRVARGLISCGPAADPGRSVSRVPPIGRVGHDGHSGHSKSALCFPLNALAYRHLPVKSVAELTRWRRRFRICPFFWCSACAILASMKQGLKIVRFEDLGAAIGTHGRGARISEVVLLDRHGSFYVTCSPGPLLPMERGALVRDGYG